MEKIKDFLMSIGFKKNEAVVYTCLVEVGTSSVSDIAKKINLHRPNIYDALRLLVSHGLVYEINEFPTLFAARPPQSLLSYIQKKELELNQIFKDYEEEQKNVANKNELKVKLTKGVFAAREALSSLLEEKKPIDVYGIPSKAIEVLGSWIINKFHKQRIKRGIPMRQIYNSDCKKRVIELNKMKLTEARYLPERYDSFTTTNIAGNKLALIMWDKELTIIEIYDKLIVEPYKHYFNILWEKSKK